MSKQYSSSDETAHGPGRAAAISWDWKGQPDLAALRRLLHDLAGVHLHQVDTGTDDIAIVLATTALDDATALAVWEADDGPLVDLADIHSAR